MRLDGLAAALADPDCDVDALVAVEGETANAEFLRQDAFRGELVARGVLA